jgi:hypothetical protein
MTCTIDAYAHDRPISGHGLVTRLWLNENKQGAAGSFLYQAAVVCFPETPPRSTLFLSKPIFLQQMRYEILKAVKIIECVSHLVLQCGFVSRYERFGETYCFHLQGWRWRQYIPPKNWHIPTSPDGVVHITSTKFGECLLIKKSKYIYLATRHKALRDSIYSSYSFLPSALLGWVVTVTARPCFTPGERTPIFTG